MKAVGAGVIGIMLYVSVVGTAEAGVGDWLKNGWTYVTSPVNCVVELGKNLLSDAGTFVKCVLNNAARNPATLTPLVTIP